MLKGIMALDGISRYRPSASRLGKARTVDPDHLSPILGVSLDEGYADRRGDVGQSRSDGADHCNVWVTPELRQLSVTCREHAEGKWET